MALDGVSETEVNVIPVQEVDSAVMEIGDLVKIAGEAEVVDSAIVILLCKSDATPNGEPMLEVQFAGDPSKLENMLDEARSSIRKLAHEAKESIANSEAAAATALAGQEYYYDF